MTTPTPPETFGYAGQADETAGSSDFNALAFVIQQVLSGLATAAVVQVKSVTNNGNVAGSGMVSVFPLVSQMDGAGNVEPHGIIHNVPYGRIQGGGNALIIDPQVGDIGVAVFANRDISAVKASRAAGPPGSWRRFDWADGLYCLTILSADPTQYIDFNASGITVVSPYKVTVQAPTVEIDGATLIQMTAPNIVLNGDTLINGALSQGTGDAGGAATLQGPVTINTDAVVSGISSVNHIHSESGGSGDGGPPVPGS